MIIMTNIWHKSFKTVGSFQAFLHTTFKRIFCWRGINAYFILDITTFFASFFTCISIYLNRIYAHQKYSKHSIYVDTSCVIIDKFRNFVSLNKHPFVFSSITTKKNFFHHTKNNILIKHDTCNLSLLRSVFSFFVLRSMMIISM